MRHILMLLPTKMPFATLILMRLPAEALAAALMLYYDAAGAYMLLIVTLLFDIFVPYAMLPLTRD